MPNVREQLKFWLIIIAMGTTVSLYSGKTVYALLLLEIIAAALLLITFWGGSTIKANKPTKITLFVILSSLLVYLTPISQTVWETLPGRSAYTDSVIWLKDNDQTPWLTFSLISQKTLHSFITLVSLAAIFLATLSLPIKKQIQLAYALLSIATIQAIIGLIQYTNPSATWLFFEFTSQGGAQGTYLNRDHFSALMHMTLPMAIGLLACNIGRKDAERSDSLGISSSIINNVLIFTFVSILILLGGVFSRSRAGVFLIVVAIILAITAFSRHIGGKRSAGITATIGMIGLGSAVSIGLIPVLNRFVAVNPAEDLRWTLFADAIQGIKTFFPLGSGPGTFQDIYRTLQPIERLNFVNHVHNDYLELLFETGLVGVVILVLVLVTYIHGWIALKHYRWDTYRFIKVAAGLGVFLIALHSTVDFNLHTPANAVFVSVLLALFLSTQKHK